MPVTVALGDGLRPGRVQGAGLPLADFGQIGAEAGVIGDGGGGR
jgi:hypothetical protein